MRSLIALVIIALAAAAAVAGEPRPAAEQAVLITRIEGAATAAPTNTFNLTVHLAFGHIDGVYYDGHAFTLVKSGGGNGTYTYTFRVSKGASAGYYTFVFHAVYDSHREHCETYSYTDPETNETKTVHKCFERDKHYEDTRVYPLAVVRAVLHPPSVVLPFIHSHSLGVLLGQLNYTAAVRLDVLGAKCRKVRVDYAILMPRGGGAEPMLCSCGYVREIIGTGKAWVDGRLQRVNSSPAQLYIALSPGWHGHVLPRTVKANLSGDTIYGYWFGDSAYELEDVGGLVELNASFVEDFWRTSRVGPGAPTPARYIVAWNVTVFTDAGNYTETFFSNLTVAAVSPANLTRGPGRWSLESVSAGGTGGMPVTVYVESPTAGVHFEKRVGPLAPGAEFTVGGNASGEERGGLFVVTYRFPTSIGQWDAQYVIPTGPQGFLDLRAAAGPGTLYVTVGGVAGQVSVHVSPPVSRPSEWSLGDVNGTVTLTAALPVNYTGNLTVTARYRVGNETLEKSVTVRVEPFNGFPPGRGGAGALAMSLAAGAVAAGLLLLFLVEAGGGWLPQLGGARVRLARLGLGLVEKGAVLLPISVILFGETWNRIVAGELWWISSTLGLQLPPVRDVGGLIGLVAGQIAAAHAMTSMAAAAAATGYASAAVLSTVKLDLNLFVGSLSVSVFAGLRLLADMLEAATVAAFIVAVVADPLAVAALITLGYLYPVLLVAGFAAALAPGGGRLGAKLILFAVLLPLFLPIPLLAYQLYIAHIYPAMTEVFASYVASQLSSLSNPLSWLSLPLVVQNVATASAAWALSVLIGFTLLTVSTALVALASLWLAWQIV